MKIKVINIFLCLLLIANVIPVIGLTNNSERTADEDVKSLIVTLESESYLIDRSIGDKTEIIMGEYGNILVPGYPKLPSKIFLVGVPPGGEVTSVELLSKKYETVMGSYKVVLAPSYTNGIDIMENEIYEDIYSSSDPFPTNIFEYLGMGHLRKYSFAKIRFSPISYIPSEGKLIIYSYITLKIDYKIVKELSNEQLSDIVMDDVASEIIVNYPSINQLYNPNPQSLHLVSYDYIIITTSSLESSITFLKNWKEYIGYTVKVVNISWISSQYSGLDLEEKIRNFLIDKYISWGIEYVLIVGSHSVIPMRYCYPDRDNHNSNGKTPTDYYYADLTGSWDSDGDGYYGERYDDSPDFNAEVWVGRIPVDNPEVVESICQKTINFEQSTGSWKGKALLCGSILNYANEDYSDWPKTDDATVMKELEDDIFQPNGFSCITMYEKEGLDPSSYSCDYGLTSENVLAIWPNGYGVAALGGHGNYNVVSRKIWESDDGNGVPETYEMLWINYFTSSDCVDLNNDKPSIVFSQSCLTASPENSGNLGKSLLEYGSVAYIGATRLSWYTVGWDDESYGGNQAIVYYFFKYLISQDQPCGKALYNCKLFYLDNFDWWEWVIFQNLYDFCLYGDPTVSLTSYPGGSPPDIPNKPYGPEIGKPFNIYSYSTSTTDPDGHEIYYKWDWGDGSFSDWLGPYPSGVTVEAEHEWIVGGVFEVVVKAKDSIGSESSWSDPLVVTIESSSPETPVITGETSGKVGVSYIYSALSSDPDGDQIWYWFDWGDNSNTGWVGPYSSGVVASESHIWNIEGTYIIKVKAKDINGLESEWGELQVTMPRNKDVSNLLLLRFLERFPLIQKILFYFIK